MNKTYTFKELLKEMKKQNIKKDYEVYSFLQKRNLIDINIVEHINKFVEVLK